MNSLTCPSNHAGRSHCAQQSNKPGLLVGLFCLLLVAGLFAPALAQGDVKVNLGAYIDSPSATFIIEQAEATIEFADLVRTYTGDPLNTTITTDPEGLAILVTYDGQPELPTEVGVYLVEVLVDDEIYSGWNSALFRIVGDETHLDRFEEQQLQPGDTFTDCPDCPAMVMMPAGSFGQGSPETEPESLDRERPQRQVNVPAFAMGQTEITFREWDACVTDGGCAHYPGDVDWGRGDRPVINVSWNDAQQYVTWLSNTTGQDYRLPSESEWEYATRAGTTGRFNTGDCITSGQANFHGEFPAQGCPTGVHPQQTLPVASFAPNAFGLFDTHGNVGEWVQDCWNTSYDGAPSNGSVWTTGDCDRAVIRGGSWVEAGQFLRSAHRDSIDQILRLTSLGFRVARTVVHTPPTACEARPLLGQGALTNWNRKTTGENSCVWRLPPLTGLDMDADCRYFDQVFGPWPAHGTSANLTVFSASGREFVAMEFNSANIPADHTGRIMQEIPQFAGTLAGNKMWSISQCPGDFNKSLIDSEMGPGCIRRDQFGVTETFLYGGANAFSAVNRCALQPNTNYYLNIVWTDDQAGTPPADIEPLPWCVGERCGGMFTPGGQY